MSRLIVLIVVAVPFLSLLDAQEAHRGALPSGPTGGPVEVIHALFVQAQMIEDRQVMFCFPRGEDAPSLIAKVDGEKVRAVGPDLKRLDVAELRQRLPGYTGIVVVQKEFELPDAFFLKVLNERGIIFVLPQEMFAPMARASEVRVATGNPPP